MLATTTRPVPAGTRDVVRRVAACTLVLALFACGGSKGTTSRRPTATSASPEESEPAFDACTLLTSQDAAAALGGPVEVPEREDEETYLRCSYGSAGAPFGGVSLRLYQFVTAADQLLRQPGSRAVAGLGDVAVVAPTGEVTVIKGDRMFSVVVVPTRVDAKPEPAALLALARAVLVRVTARFPPAP